MKKVFPILLVVFVQAFSYSQSTSVDIGSTEKTVQRDLYGFQLSQYFRNADIDEPISAIAEGFMSDLAPSVVRFPGGGNSRFMHPDPSYGSGFGYGWDAVELCKFYNMISEGTCDCEDIADAADGMDNIFNSETELQDFFDALSTTPCMEMEMGKSLLEATEGGNLLTQIKALDDADPNYIDQFIDLINNVEYESGRSIDVVYCANILTATATEIVATLNYLIDAGINVVGIELGNEVYNKEYKDFFFDTDDGNYNGFAEYYRYINGLHIQPYSCTFYNELLSDVVGTNDHDFIEAIRTEFQNTIKIGIPAAGLISYANQFKFSGEDTTDLQSPAFDPECDGSDGSWNEGIEAHLDDEINIDMVDYPIFDAVIVHPYFFSNCLYDELESIFCDTPPASDEDDCDDDECIPETEVSDDEYDFNGDVSIADAYDSGLLDIADALFKHNADLATSGYDGDFESMIKSYDTEYSFFSGADGKELWTTEWNLQESHKDYQSVYSNTFWHGYLIFEWLLTQITLNYTADLDDDGNTDLNPDFYTISTLHNFIGESNTMMISSRDDMIGDYNAPVADDDEYVRRIPYTSYEALKPIFDMDLKYIPSTNSGISDRNNIHVFASPDNYNIFIYYSNLRTSDRTLNISGFDNLILSQTGCSYYEQYADIVSVDDDGVDNFDVLYATQGANYIYGVNSGYTGPSDIPFVVKPTLQVIHYNAGTPTATSGTFHVTLPDMSYGFIVVQLCNVPDRFSDTELAKDGVIVYPNPFSKYATVLIPEDEKLVNGLTSKVDIYIYDLAGTLVASKMNIERDNYLIERNSLAQGFYTCDIYLNNKLKSTQKLIIQ